MKSSIGRWYLQQYTLLVASGLVLLWIFASSDLDRTIAWMFFDREAGDFLLHRNRLFEAVFHKGARGVVHILALSALVPCWLGWKGRLAWLPPRNALLAALGMYLIPFLIASLKQMTDRHCPWSIVEFGGSIPYRHLLEASVPGFKSGKCFPAGHASAGFLWLVWAVALRPAGTRYARLALYAGLAAGTLLGLFRMAQGAHFLSHTLASLWLAWFVSITLALLVGADISARRETDTI